MKASYLEFNAAAERIVTSIPDRTRIITAALALAVAFSPAAAIPSAPVQDPTNHYQMTVQMAVERLVYAINEGAVFDPKGAMEMVRAFWLVRYAGVHGTPLMGLYTQLGFFDSVMCVGIYVPEEMHCFLNQYKVEILGLLGEAVKVVAGEGNV